MGFFDAPVDPLPKWTGMDDSANELVMLEKQPDRSSLAISGKCDKSLFQSSSSLCPFCS